VLHFKLELAFLIDQQYLSYFSPKHWIEDTENFDDKHYIDTHNHIGVVSANNIKVDILVDASSTSKIIDGSKDIFSFDIQIESIEDILAKKIVFRKKDNKGRDILDIAVAISHDEHIIEKLLAHGRVTKEDLEIFSDALENINLQKYHIAIELVEPIKEYRALAENAPQYIIEKIKKLMK